MNLNSTLSLIHRAEKAGYRAIVLTVDVTSIGKKRPGADIRNDGLPKNLSYNLILFNLYFIKIFSFRNFDNDQAIQRLLNAKGLLDDRVSSMFETAITWSHVALLTNYTKLPVRFGVSFFSSISYGKYRETSDFRCLSKE